MCLLYALFYFYKNIVFPQTHQMVETGTFQTARMNKSSRCFPWIILFLPHSTTERSSDSVSGEELGFRTIQTLRSLRILTPEPLRSTPPWGLYGVNLRTPICPCPFSLFYSGIHVSSSIQEAWCLVFK